VRERREAREQKTKLRDEGIKPVNCPSRSVNLPTKPGGRPPQSVSVPTNPGNLLTKSGNEGTKPVSFPSRSVSLPANSGSPFPHLKSSLDTLQRIVMFSRNLPACRVSKYAYFIEIRKQRTGMSNGSAETCLQQVR
jgi:hypothetical protein